MNYTTAPPPGPRLQPGDELTMTLGPRRIVHPDDCVYVQKHHRRYYARVLSAHDERYTTGTGRRLTRRVCIVRILPN